MKAVTRITFLDEAGEKFFGEGPARLLHGIEEKGSLRSAAISMDMAYTKALRILKNAEAALGFPLATRTTGGKDGGGSKLTTEGKAWLTKFEAYRDACNEANRVLYQEFFPAINIFANLYNYCKESQVGFVKALFGEIPFQTKSPVKIVTLESLIED